MRIQTFVRVEKESLSFSTGETSDVVKMQIKANKHFQKAGISSEFWKEELIFPPGIQIHRFVQKRIFW